MVKRTTLDVNNEYKIIWPDLYKLANKNGWRIHNLAGKKDWYSCEINNTVGSATFDKMHQNVIEWIYKNIEGCEKHCYWYRMNDDMFFQFRHKKNYTWFCLRWL